MNWNLFYSVFAIMFLLSAPMFKILNDLSVRLGQVPAGGNHWYNRRFAYWKDETTLYVGNPFFFSLMDALIAVSINEIEWTYASIAWIICSLPIGALSTYLWFKSATARYKSGEIKSFGWQWCKPKTISIAGWYHTVYFFIHAIAIASVAIFFLSQLNVSIHLKAGMLFSIAGYIATARHFIHVGQRMDSMQEELEKNLPSS